MRPGHSVVLGSEPEALLRVGVSLGEEFQIISNHLRENLLVRDQDLPSVMHSGLGEVR